MEEVIWGIMKKHEECEWLELSRAAFPGISDGEILDVIQLYFCEDIEELLERLQRLLERGADLGEVHHFDLAGVDSPGAITTPA